MRELKNFVSSRLKKREKIILEEIARNNDKVNVTKFVRFVSEKYNFSETSVWYILRKLMASNLIVFGNGRDIRMNVKLTHLGEILLEV
jgi:hypothetical protein